MGFDGGGANSSSEGTSNMSGLLVAARMLSSAPAAFVFPPIPFKAPPGFATGFRCSSGSGASSLSWGVEMDGRADLPYVTTFLRRPAAAELAGTKAAIGVRASVWWWSSSRARCGGALSG
jgi:hypothetical protein